MTATLPSDMIALIAKVAGAETLEAVAAAIGSYAESLDSVDGAAVLYGETAAALSLRTLAQRSLELGPRRLMGVEHALREWLAGVAPPPGELTGFPPPHAIGVKVEAGEAPLHLYPAPAAGHEPLFVLAVAPSPTVDLRPDHPFLLAARDLLHLGRRESGPDRDDGAETSEREGHLRREEILTRSPLMEKIFRKLDRVVNLDVPVLIMGETGTGKELIAQALHRSSPRSRRRFYAQNCGAISEGLLESELFGYTRGAFTGADRDKKGLFEVSSGSTLFLDEIGEMNLDMQKKLLRVLQEREVLPIGASEPRKVDVRIVCATNRNLKDEVREGRFREDLYYRLQVIQVTLPPLRDRREDIPLLIDHFLDKVAARRNTPRKVIDRRDPRVMELFLNFDWPGNIRELENSMTRLAHFSGEIITWDVLAEDHQFMHEIERHDVALRPVHPLDETLAEVERREIENALRHTRGNRTRAADLLRVNRRSLLRRLKRYGIE